MYFTKNLWRKTHVVKTMSYEQLPYYLAPILFLFVPSPPILGGFWTDTEDDQRDLVHQSLVSPVSHVNIVGPMNILSLVKHQSPTISLFLSSANLVNLFL